MITKCPHCNTRFKAPDDSKGRKTKCPKCEEPFTIHEFAGEAVPSTGAKDIRKKEPDVCARCARKIGQDEQTYVFKGVIVCAECDKKLRSEDEQEKEEQTWGMGKSVGMIFAGIGLCLLGIGLIVFAVVFFLELSLTGTAMAGGCVALGGPIFISGIAAIVRAVSSLRQS